MLHWLTVTQLASERNNLLNPAQVHPERGQCSLKGAKLSKKAMQQLS